jgi:hypothetical protein
MPIDVVCPGCKKRFAVSDKFAGKKGPCPKCKAVIQVPEKSEEVVVHGPDEFGPKDTKGRATLKPIARRETKFSPILTGAIVGAVLLVVFLAWMLRSEQPEDTSMVILAIGALVLGPPLALGGYTFLRDDELAPYSGTELLIRVAACSVVYAITWGLVAIVQFYLFDGDPLEVTHMLFVAPAMFGVGAFAAYLSLDLEWGTAAIHYGMYLLVTIALRLVMGLPAI